MMPLKLCWRRCSEDGHRMYFWGSVVDKASIVGIGISPTPPLIFTGGQKVRNLASFKTSLWAARVWKCSKISEFWNKSAMLRWLPYVLAKFGEVGSTHPRTSVVTHPVKFNSIFGWVHLLPYCIVSCASRSRTPDTRSQCIVRNEQ